MSNRIAQIAVAVASLSVVAGCGSSPPSATDSARKQLAEVRGQIAAATQQRTAARAKFTATKQRIRARVDEVRAQATRDERAARRKVSREEAKLERLRSQVSGVDAQIAKNTIDGTGTYVVGEDIQPGTYRAAAQPGCYWARLNSLDTSDIADNDNADGPVVIDVLSSDRALHVEDCATFHKVD